MLYKTQCKAEGFDLVSAKVFAMVKVMYYIFITFLGAWELVAKLCSYSYDVPPIIL